MDKQIGEMRIELRQMRKQKDELQSELIEMGLNEKLMKKLLPEVQVNERELMEQMDVDSHEKDDTITEPSGTEVLQDKVSEPSTSQLYMMMQMTLQLPIQK